MFSREHRSGIFLLLILILFGQLSYFFLSENLFQKKEIKEDKAWLLVQNEIDSLKQIVNQSIIPRVTGNGIILGEPIDPVSIYRRAMDIFDKQLVLAKKQQYIKQQKICSWG